MNARKRPRLKISKGASRKAVKSSSARAFFGGVVRKRMIARLMHSMRNAMKPTLRVAQPKPRVGCSLRKTIAKMTPPAILALENLRR